MDTKDQSPTPSRHLSPVEIILTHYPGIPSVLIVGILKYDALACIFERAPSAARIPLSMAVASHIPAFARTIFHVDMDAFFVSVEELYRSLAKRQSSRGRRTAGRAWRGFGGIV